MDSSFTPIEQMLKFRASRHEDFPYQEILLTRLCMHMRDVVYGVDYAGVSGKPQYSAF